MREAKERTENCKLNAIQDIVLCCFNEAEVSIYTNFLTGGFVNLDQILDVFPILFLEEYD
jgi:hypothetical protein